VDAGVKRLAAACTAAFAVVGQNFNQYWGSLIAPLLCFGVARFPASLWDMCRTAVQLPPQQGSLPGSRMVI
jgi:hypothetical protein